MAILALYERLLVLGPVALGISLAPLLACIHGTPDVGVAPTAGLLELHGSAQVLRLDPVVGGVEVGAVHRLVAQ